MSLDRLEALERQVSVLSRNLAKIPVRFASGGTGAASSDSRAIRGAFVSGTTTLIIDAIVTLDSGKDPRVDDTDPTEAISVANVPADTYTSGEHVYADWSEVNEQWEARPKSSGSEKLRLIRGRVTGDTDASEATFTIDTVEPLAGSQNPLMDPDDTSETVEIINSASEDFYEDEIIVAVAWANPVEDGPNWRTLETERFRALRGVVYSQSGTTVTVNTLVVLESGKDPRIDPTDDTETVDATVIDGTTFTFGDDIWLDWSFADSSGRWEARPKSGGGSKIRFARVTVEIPAATGPLTADWGTTGKVKFQDDAAGTVDSVETDVINKWIGVSFVVDAQVELDASGPTPIVLSGTCSAVGWSG